MPRPRDKNSQLAIEMWTDSGRDVKLRDIAAHFGIPVNQLICNLRCSP